MLALLTLRSQDDVNSAWEGKSSYGELKSAVAEAVRQFLGEFQSKLNQVNEPQVLDKLKRDEQAMNEIANATLYRVQQAVGLRQR
jgi:tryptophanyl-tRNA synthetase